MEAIKLISQKADTLFFDCKVDGFDREKCTAYNILMSAAVYLNTGEPLIGNRTLKFFGL